MPLAGTRRYTGDGTTRSPKLGTTLRQVERHLRRSGLAGVVALIVLTSACTGDEPPNSPSHKASAPASTPPTNPGPTPDVAVPDEAKSGASYTPTTSAATAQAGPSVERVATTTTFASPSGNILCFLGEDIATCRVQRHDWKVPPRPADCNNDWGPDIEVTSDRATFRCASDAIPYDWTATHRLAYGHAIRFRQLQCESARAGMRCDYLGSGHGFTVSSTDYELR